MLFGKSEDQKQIEAMFNARQTLQNGLTDRVNKDELDKLFKSYKEACDTYINTLKNVMAVAMVYVNFSDDKEVESSIQEARQSIQQFVKGVLSDIYCMEVKVAKASTKSGDLTSSVTLKMNEIKAMQNLRMDAENFKIFMGEINENPGMHAKFNVEGKNSKQISKENKVLLENFLKVYRRTENVFNVARNEVRDALAKQNQNKR